MRDACRRLAAAAAVMALTAPAPALASHEGSSQPAQPVPSQGGAPQPAAPAAEEDDGASAGLTAGVVGGLLVLGGGLAFAKQRRGASTAPE